MKKIIKSGILLTLCATLLSIFFIASNAAANDTVCYTITSKDGTVVEYKDESRFYNSVSAASDGDTITLCKSIEITQAMNLISSKSAPRTLNFNLAGYGIYCYSKVNLFSVGDYTTVNVYSTKEDGFLYVIDKSNSNAGGSVFFAAGKEARVNFGTMLVNGTVYPGSNISTFSSSFLNVEGTGTVGIYGEGGTHFANVNDWSGFICLRTGNGNISIKNMDLIAVNNTYLINGIDNTKSSLYMENCRMIRADGMDMPMFNQSFGTITMKDCVMNYSLSVGSAAYATDNIILQGNNIFSSALGINTTTVKDSKGLTLAQVNYDYTFINGTKAVWYYENDGRFNKTTLTMPEVSECCVLAAEENTVEYTWVSNGKSVTQVWLASEEPVFPMTLGGTASEGLYKPHWTRSEDGRKITYTGGIGLDFSIKASVEYDGYLCMNIYIPADMVLNGYLDFTSVTVNGDSYGKNMWSSVTVDGESYYMASTPYISDDPNQKFSIKLACDYDSKTHAESTYTVSLPSYIEKIIENRDSYSSEQLEIVGKVIDTYFKGQYVW